MKLSIIVLTHNRQRQCLKCLRSLVEAIAQTSQINCEIILGLNGLDHETERLAKEELARSGVTFCMIFSSLRKTPSAFRNDLLKATSGHWIYFIDDDAFVEPDIFKKFLSLSEEFKDSIALGGPNLTPMHSSRFQRATGAALSSAFATYFSSPRYGEMGRTRRCGEESLMLCNLFVKREALGSEPFPEDFLCCEENWLLQNLEKKGYTFSYCPSLYVWHERRADLFSFIKQIFHYGFGRGQILKRKPDGVRVAHLIPTLSIVYCLILIAASLFYRVPAAWLVPFVTYMFLGVIAISLIFRQQRYSFSDLVCSYSLFPVIHASYGCGLIAGLLRG